MRQVIKYNLWEDLNAIDESQLREEGVDSDRNAPNWPKCRMGVTKPHEKAHGSYTICDWVVL